MIFWRDLMDMLGDVAFLTNNAKIDEDVTRTHIVVHLAQMTEPTSAIITAISNALKEVW